MISQDWAREVPKERERERCFFSTRCVKHAVFNSTFCCSTATCRASARLHPEGPLRLRADSPLTLTAALEATATGVGKAKGLTIYDASGVRQRLTYKELLRHARQIAAGLCSMRTSCGNLQSSFSVAVMTRVVHCDVLEICWSYSVFHPDHCAPPSLFSSRSTNKTSAVVGREGLARQLRAALPFHFSRPQTPTARTASAAACVGPSACDVHRWPKKRERKRHHMSHVCRGIGMRFRPSGPGT